MNGKCTCCESFEEVDEIITKWNIDPDFVIEMFQDIQDTYRYIPKEALEYVAKKTGVPRSRLFHIVTFYNAFSLKPRGEIEIQVCMGTACYVKGAQEINFALERELGIKSGETTSDGRFSLIQVRCLGCCGLAPVITIGDKFFGDVKPTQVAVLLADYRKL